MTVRPFLNAAVAISLAVGADIAIPEPRACAAVAACIVGMIAALWLGYAEGKRDRSDD